MKHLAITLFAVFCASCTSNTPIADTHPAIPPEFFEQVCCWISDTEQPVVTEFSLDALERNRNQFPHAVRARDGEWEEWQRENNAGFARYRFLPDENGHFMVEYQDNGGGSLTTSTRIGFSVLTRTIAKDGHPEKIRVLRVESIESVPQPEKRGTPSN